ncbi:MAG: hypothetical protein MHMPM18_001938 [Marteilia pararefringens]
MKIGGKKSGTKKNVWKKTGGNNMIDARLVTKIQHDDSNINSDTFMRIGSEDIDNIKGCIQENPDISHIFAPFWMNFKSGIIPELSKLSRMRFLSLYGCGIEALPRNICLLTSLRSLYLNYNRLSSLPDGLGMMQLVSLDLSGNMLNNSCFQEITKIRSLEKLMLSDNYIAGVVPESLKLLTGLKLLVLRNNSEIAIMPDVFDRIGDLRSLDISFTAIEFLPPTLAEVLKYASFHSNFSKCPLNKLILEKMQTRASIVEYIATEEYKKIYGEMLKAKHVTIPDDQIIEEIEATDSTPFDDTGSKASD